MTSENPGSRPTSRRGYVILIAAFLLVCGGWSAAWIYGRSILAERMEAERENLLASGVSIQCADLGIAGFPFRYEVECGHLDASVAPDGSKANLPRMLGVALIYNPRHVIIEAKGPIEVSLPASGLIADATWQSARASLKFSEAAVDKVDAVFTAPALNYANSMVSSGISADGAELHLRQAPDAAGVLEGFLSFSGIRSNALPAIEAAMDIRLHVQLENGSALLSGGALGDLPRKADGTLPVRLALLEVVSSGSRLGASGDFVINEDGTLTGTVDLALSAPDNALEMAKPLLQDQSTLLPVLNGLITSLKTGETDADGAPVIRLPLSISRGLVSLGFLQIGRIPPVVRPGS